MLCEIRIENFAIIERLEIHFDEGFNVITGETGAGKSIIIDAVDLLLGGRADPTFVRAGAEVARVEGIFAIDPKLRPTIQALLAREELLDDELAGEIAISREIRREGRSTGRINGRMANLAFMKEVGQVLVDVHGQ